MKITSIITKDLISFLFLWTKEYTIPEIIYLKYTINNNGTLLLRCDPQKEILKHSNTNTKALNPCSLYTKLKESSG